jgi:hypothetical protein
MMASVKGEIEGVRMRNGISIFITINGRRRRLWSPPPREGEGHSLNKSVYDLLDEALPLKES